MWWTRNQVPGAVGGPWSEVPVPVPGGGPPRLERGDRLHRRREGGLPGPHVPGAVVDVRGAPEPARATRLPVRRGDRLLRRMSRCTSCSSSGASAQACRLTAATPGPAATRRRRTPRESRRARGARSAAGPRRPPGRARPGRRQHRADDDSSSPSRPMTHPDGNASARSWAMVESTRSPCARPWIALRRPKPATSTSVTASRRRVPWISRAHESSVCSSMWRLTRPVVRSRMPWSASAAASAWTSSDVPVADQSPHGPRRPRTGTRAGGPSRAGRPRRPTPSGRRPAGPSRLRRARAARQDRSAVAEPAGHAGVEARSRDESDPARRPTVDDADAQERRVEEQRLDLVHGHGRRRPPPAARRGWPREPRAGRRRSAGHEAGSGRRSHTEGGRWNRRSWACSTSRPPTFTCATPGGVSRRRRGASRRRRAARSPVPRRSRTAPRAAGHRSARRRPPR